MTRRRQTPPLTPSLDGQKERTDRHMTNKKKNAPAQRLGAAALATATVVSGLAFGPGAVAAPLAERGATVTSTTDESTAAESTRRVGPLVINSSADTQYGLHLDPDTVRTTAVGDASWFSVPDIGQQGQVRGTGENGDRCLVPDSGVYLALATCSDSANQVWTWTDTGAVQGADKTLAPVGAPTVGLTPRGLDTYMSLSAGGKRPLVMDDRMIAERDLTASTTGVPGRISGVGTTGATVSARGESVVVSDDGTYELALPGVPTDPTTIVVTQTLPNGDVQDTVEVEVEGTGPLDTVAMAPVELARGADSEVTFEATVTDDFLNRPAAEVTLTAPEGTTFAEGQDELGGVFIRDGVSSSGGMQLKNGERSEDGRTYTYVWDTVANGATGWQSPKGDLLRWKIAVSTPSGAADVEGNAMAYQLVGTSTQGAFRATGEAPVSIPGDFGPMAPVAMAPVELSRGAEREVTFETKVADEFLSVPSASVTVTAPEGTTFAEGQDEIAGAYIRNGVPSSGGMHLKGGERSEDGRTYTYTWDTVANGAPYWRSPEDEILRWKIAVVAAADAADVEGNTMGYQFVGTSTGGSFRATGTAPVSITGDFGTIAPVEVESTELVRGEDTPVSFIVENTENRSGLLPTVTLTAPEGTTFAPDTAVEAEWRNTGTSAWNYGGNMRMTDVTISDDGRTLTGTKASGTVGGPQEFKFTVMVSTPSDAADVADNALGFVYEGTSSTGAFQATGEAPVSITGDFGTVAPVEVESTELVRGEDTPVSFIVENTENRSGLLPTVTLTAPEGTTFAPDTAIEAEWRNTGTSAWNYGGNMRMTDVTISDDGRTLTGTKASGTVGSPQEFKLTVMVSTPADAADVADNALGFVYEGTSSAGAFRATGTAPVSIVSSFSPVTLDNFADGDTFTPGDVTFSGTGTPGATVTVSPSTAAGVSTEVRPDGTWSAVRYLGNAAYTMSVTQLAASGEDKLENIRLFSDAVVEQDFSVTSPAAGAGHTQQGWVTFTGVGTTWSTVSISDGSDVAATKATVQYDGTWSARRWVGTEKTTFTVTSSRADVQNGSQTIEFNTGVSGQAFSLDSHTDGGTFTPGNITFRGKGSTGDMVTFTAPGLAPLEATVNAAGEWSIPRWLGNGTITFTVTHTPVTGDQTQQTLRLFSDQVAQGDLIVTAPIDGASHDQPGWVTFTGTGTTWSKVSVSDDTSAEPSVATVQIDGSWTVRRWVGTTATTFTVTSERAGIANGSQTIEFNVGEAADGFTIGSHTDGGTFTPGNVAITGTGTTGDKVTITAPGLAPLETEVDSRGRWSIQRWLGNGFITFTVTHTPVTGDETQQTLRLFSDQVVQGDLVVTAPVDGASHSAAGFVTFTGTGTTWSKVSVSDGTSAAPSVATVQYDGSWTIRRWVGTDPVTFTVTSERADIANGSETIRFNTAE